MRKSTNSDLNFIKGVAYDILEQEISEQEAITAFNAVSKYADPDSANFYYELKSYFIN